MNAKRKLDDDDDDDDKTLSCNLCNKKYTKVESLEIHKVLHTILQEFNREPFQCTLCARKFARRFNLNRHYRAVHKI